jgi:hypothetical protein
MIKLCVGWILIRKDFRPSHILKVEWAEYIQHMMSNHFQIKFLFFIETRDNVYSMK